VNEGLNLLPWLIEHRYLAVRKGRRMMFSHGMYSMWAEDSSNRAFRMADQGIYLCERVHCGELDAANRNS
jgi:hypothetical protein